MIISFLLGIVFLHSCTAQSSFCFPVHKEAATEVNDQVQHCPLMLPEQLHQLQALMRYQSYSITFVIAILVCNMNISKDCLDKVFDGILSCHIYSEHTDDFIYLSITMDCLHTLFLYSGRDNNAHRDEWEICLTIKDEKCYKKVCLMSSSS